MTLPYSTGFNAGVIHEWKNDKKFFNMTKLMFNQSSEEYTNSLWYNGAGGGLEMKYVRLDLAATVFLLNLDA